MPQRQPAVRWLTRPRPDAHVFSAGGKASSTDHRSPAIVDDDKDLPAGSVSAVVIWSEKEKKKSVAMDVGGVAVVNHS
jgi:hypothetical protein